MTGGTRKSSRGRPPFEEGTHDAEVENSTPVDQSVPYIYPRCEGVPPPWNPKGKYTIHLSNIPDVVPLDGSLVGRLYELQFSYHDFHDDKKIPYFKPQYYMNAIVVVPNYPPVLQFQQRALGLETSGITNLLDIQHFGRSNYITYCVKMLLSCVHGGYLWLNPNVSIDA